MCFIRYTGSSATAQAHLTGGKTINRSQYVSPVQDLVIRSLLQDKTDSIVQVSYVIYNIVDSLILLNHRLTYANLESLISVIWDQENSEIVPTIK